MKLPPLSFTILVIAFSALLHAEPGPVEVDPEAVSKTSIEAIVSDREKLDLVLDSDLAETISRRPDLSFRNVTIDGEVATVSLKDIQADQMESAEVSKSVTPDLDADLRGSGLNLRSKPTYDLKKRVIKLSLNSTRDPILRSFDKEGSLSYGQSMGRWGFMVFGSAEKGPFATESYNQDWLDLGSPGDSHYVLKDQLLFYSRTDELEFKANGTIDFKLNDQVRLYVKGDILSAERSGYRPRLTIRYNRGDYENVSETGADVSGALVERYASGWETEVNEYSLTTGGYLDFERLLIDYQLSYNDEHKLIPDVVASKFLQRKMDLRYDLSNKYGPFVEVQSETGSELNDPDLFVNDWTSRNRMEDRAQNWLSTANIRIPVNRSWFKGYIKSGFKLRGLDYEESADNRFYDNLDPSFTIADVLGDYDNPDILSGFYDHGPFGGKEEVREYFDTHSSSFAYNQTRSREESDPETYSVSQDIYAGYSMVYLDLDKLRIIGGLRYEQTELSYTANELILDENGEYLSTNEVADSNSYSNWFPGIHGRYDSGPFSFVGSWSNTIHRPNFGLVVPYRNTSREAKIIHAGNPELNPTLYTNYDFAIDYSLDGSDLISMEFFYQTLEDIVYREVSVIKEGPYDGYEFSTTKNGPSGDIYGVRLIWSQDIGNWMDVVRGLSLNAKYTYRISETIYPGRPNVVLSMPRRPENSFEINLSYKKSRLFAQLEFGYVQSSLDRINDEAEWRDIYSGAFTRLDFSSSFQVARGVRFLFDIQNITNEIRDEEYFGEGALLSDYGYSPRRYRLAMKFDL